MFAMESCPRLVVISAPIQRVSGHVYAQRGLPSCSLTDSILIRTERPKAITILYFPPATVGSFAALRENLIVPSYLMIRNMYHYICKSIFMFVFVTVVCACVCVFDNMCV